MLFGAPNVVCTPHLGAATTEAQENVALQVAEQMSDYLVHGAISNALNAPSVTAEEAPILQALDRARRDARQLRRAGHRARDQRDRDRVRRRGRPAQPQAADRGADRGPSHAAGRRGRGQHGLRAGGRPRARHPHRRDPQGRPGRLRLLHAADRDHRGSRPARSPAPSTPTASRGSSRSRGSTSRPSRCHSCSTPPTPTRPATSARSAPSSGRSGINIATFALGRAQKSGEAIALLGVDEAVAPAALGRDRDAAADPPGQGAAVLTAPVARPKAARAIAALLVPGCDEIRRGPPIVGRASADRARPPATAHLVRAAERTCGVGALERAFFFLISRLIMS